MEGVRSDRRQPAGPSGEGREVHDDVGGAESHVFDRHREDIPGGGRRDEFQEAAEDHLPRPRKPHP